MKVFIIGLDGATLELIEKWAGEGKLPTLKKLMCEGTWGHLKTVPNQNSAPAWTSFMTGKNPGKHGIYYFYERLTGSYDIRYLNGGDCKAETIWSILSRNGKKVGAINIPMTYPAEEVNGFIVAGMDAPGVDSTGFTYPEGLKEELLKAVPRYVIEPGITGFVASGRQDMAVCKAMDAIKARTSAAFHLMDNYTWDVFMLVYREIDVLQHFFWKYMDATHPDHVARQAEKYGDVIFNCYRQLDEDVAKLLSRLGSDVSIVMLSDHGGAPSERGPLYMNHFLKAIGVLEFKDASKGTGGLLKNIVSRSLKAGISCVHKYTSRRTKEKLLRFFPKLRDRIEANKYFGNINWQKTKFFSDGSRIELWVNLKGRDPQGVVAKEEYDMACEYVRERLYQWADPLTGKKVVKKVLRKEETYNGPCVDGAPDILIFFEDGVFINGVGIHEPGSKDIKVIPVNMNTADFPVNGAHRDNGVFFLKGEGIKKGMRLRGATIMDLAPTVLYIMDNAVPSDMDGKPLLDAFEENYTKAKKVRFTDWSAIDARDKREGYSPGDTEVIKDRLKGLGYLE